MADNPFQKYVGEVIPVDVSIPSLKQDQPVPAPAPMVSANIPDTTKPLQIDSSGQVVTPPQRPSLPRREISQQPMPQGDIIPGNTRLTQSFGNPNAALYGRDKSGKARINRGEDYAIPENTPLAAPPEGKWVVKAVQTGGWNTGWGNSVVLQNSETGETLRYSHLNKANVKPGQLVTGKQIGLSGRTGRTTGPHLDIEYTDSKGRLQAFSRSPYSRYI